MKDFKDLIKIADVYGTETRDLLEKKEAGQLDEGWWEDLTGFVKKTLGMNDAQAAEIAQDVQKKTGADPEADKPLDIKNPKDAPAQADAPAEPASKGLDVTTPNLMKAYNDGGKKPMDNIKAMQQALTDAGHDTKGIDGKYGPGTFAAVKSFQTAQGLKADGQAGPNTMKALQNAGGSAKADAPAAEPAAAGATAGAAAGATAGAATGPDGNPTGGAATAAAPDGNPTQPPADQAAAQASQQGVDAADVAAASGQAQAGVDGADQAELDAGAGQKQGDDPMTAANQAKDRKPKQKTDRQQMATTEAVNEASMNISMNGTDAREVAELVGILKNAGMEEPKMMAIKALPKMGPMDMDKPSPMGMDRSSPLHSMSSSPCSEDEAEYNALMDEWDNSPDPEYKDDDYMLNDLAGGINKPKKMYPATQPGDNPMAVKEALWKALQEKYTTNEESRGKKKLKASRGEKLNASRGDKLMASRGKDKKTTEGSRGKKSRGKKSRG